MMTKTNEQKKLNETEDLSESHKRKMLRIFCMYQIHQTKFYQSLTKIVVGKGFFLDVNVAKIPSFQQHLRNW
jgi:hypothetical protein